jgi:hypothetical protein
MFTWRRLFSARNRALLMVGIPLLSILSLFTPFFSSDASAVTGDQMRQKAEVWRGLSSLLESPGVLRNNVSAGDANSCNFYSSSVTPGSPRLTSGNLASVGLTCADFLKAIGYSPPSGAQGTYNKPGNLNKDSMLNALSASGFNSATAFYGGNLRTGTPSDAIAYTIAMNMLRGSCTVGFRTELLDPIPGFNGDPTNDQRVNWMREGGTGQTPLNGDSADTATNYHFWMWTVEGNKVSKNIYHAGESMDSYFDVGYGTGFMSNYQTGPRDADFPYETDCYQAARLLQDNKKYADAFAAVVTPGGDVTAGTCLDRYEGQPQQLAACDAGFNNKGNTNFCPTTYPQVPISQDDDLLRDACFYGQQQATGDSSAKTPAPEGEAAEDTTSCRVEGVGWIICPLFTFLAKITDATYEIVKNMLVVQPLNTTGESGLFTSWSIMRNFANVAFVIAFLVIIFSQLTGAGISNYGIKKMLPRLVVAAILVNVSYWICAIAVDISNILGSSLYTLLAGMQQDAGIPVPTDGSAFSSGQGGWTGVTVAALAAVGVAFFVTLAVLLPMLVVVLATILTVFIALILRQALIIILIVLSPLAFVAYLLPNTESLFNKWRGFLQILLMMYPIIAILFGGAALASTIIMGSSEEWYVQIAGAAAAVIPLAAAPALIGSFNKFAGRFGLPKVGFKLDRTKAAAGKYAGRRKNIATARRLEGKSMFGTERLAGRIRGDGSSRFRRMSGAVVGSGVSFAQNRAVANLTKDQKNANAEKAVTEAKQSYTAGRIAQEMAASENDTSQYAQTIAGPTGDVPKIQAAAVAAQKNEIATAISQAQISADIPPGAPGMTIMADKMAQAIKEGDSITARAMQNMLLTSGSAGLSTYRDKMTQLGNEDPGLMNNSAVNEMRKNVLANHSAVKANANDIMTQAITGRTMGDVSKDPKTWTLSDSDLVHQKAASVQLALDSNAVTKEQALRIAGNPELAQHLDKEVRERVEELATRPPI